MADISNSTLSWLDSSESERRAVLELVSALNEPGTLDELGIGSIRDTISDTLFPGTSTIQTRARYFLFIPWILQMVEARPTSNPERRARELQLELCKELDKAHGEGQGVIGREAGSALQRWPISIYWLGLDRWGIKRRAGAIPSYFTRVRRQPSWIQELRAAAERTEEVRSESPDSHPGNWVNIPKPPKGFPNAATFTLTQEESKFLVDQVVLKHPQTYLAHILMPSDTAGLGNAQFPWNHPASKTAPPTTRAWIKDARLFSLVHRGATLLYNYMLAELLEDYDSTDTFAERFSDWTSEMATSRADLQSWDRPAMWNRLIKANPRIKARAQIFTNQWYGMAMAKTVPTLVKDPEARALIRNRERSLKGPRSRLTYADARQGRKGYPLSGRLQFRWPQVRQIADDILEPLGTSVA